MPAQVVGGHATAEERNQDATLYVGHLDEKVTDGLLWELFLQAGPIVSVNMPKDRVSLKHQGYGFVEFLSEEDADYAIRVLNMIKLFGKPIRVNKSNINQKNLDVGANIFIGSLDPEVDEKLLYDTFSAFGVILKTPHIQRDPETLKSKGYAFLEFASFDAADAAIEAMNGQFLMNRAIIINYAFKKDSKGERHGSAAERLLASQNPLAQGKGPNMMFSDNKQGQGMSNTVPSSIQQAIPSAQHMQAPRPGAPMTMGGPPRPGFGGIPRPGGLQRPPPPGGAPIGFGGHRMPFRPPGSGGPGNYSMAGVGSGDPTRAGYASHVNPMMAGGSVAAGGGVAMPMSRNPLMHDVQVTGTFRGSRVQYTAFNEASVHHGPERSQQLLKAQPGVSR